MSRRQCFIHTHCWRCGGSLQPAGRRSSRGKCVTGLLFSQLGPGPPSSRSPRPHWHPSQGWRWTSHNPEEGHQNSLSWAVWTVNYTGIRRNTRLHARLVDRVASALTGMPRAFTMFILHMGQVLCSCSHGSTQFLWKTWLRTTQGH